MSGDELREVDVNDDDVAEEAAAVEIPTSEISADALRGVVESYVNREGTDYGAVERSFESKVADVMGQLERGEAKVVFDPASESVTLVVVR